MYGFTGNIVLNPGLKQEKILLTRKRLLTDKNLRNTLAWPRYSHLSKYMYGFTGKFNVKKKIKLEKLY